MSPNPQIALYLMSRRGLSVLEHILRRHGSGLVAYVVSARDRHVMEDSFDETVALASGHGLPVYERSSIPASLPAVGARFAVGWRWILPHDVPEPLVVFHDSLLPRYRGFAPLVSALINGETRVGVTALLGTVKPDEGPIVAQDSIALTFPMTIGGLIDLVCPCYHRLVDEAVHQLSTGAFKIRAQDETTATYSLWRDEDDYLIDWRLDSKVLERFVDATGAPYLGASTFALGRKWRVLAAHHVEDKRLENRSPGKIIALENGRPIVVCGSGLLRLDEIVDADCRGTAIPWRVLRTRFSSSPTDSRISE